MRYIGIDPGLAGAIGWIDEEAAFCNAIRLPVCCCSKSGKKKSSGRNIDFGALLPLLREVITGGAGIFVTCERPIFRHGQSATGLCTSFQNYGHLLGLLRSLQVEPLEVYPAEWKATLGLPSDKYVSRQMAERLFPGVDLGKEGSEGKSEALLLAFYGRQCDAALPEEEEQQK